MHDFIQDDIFNVECDLLVVPVSTEGTISNSFRYGLEKLRFPVEILEDKSYYLGQVDIHALPKRKKHIAVVCTVDKLIGAYYAIQLIGKRLALVAKDLPRVKVIATPILGTGAGKLNPGRSLNIIRNAFYEVDKESNVQLIFCSPDIGLNSVLSEKNKTTNSALLVVEAELPNIRRNEQIKRIQFDTEYYYELAEQKFQEYLSFQPRNPFYSHLYEDFRHSGVTFKDYLIMSTLTEEERLFITLCGELVAYIDHNAYRKNIWNKYPDKRVLARSLVRQNAWFLNLIKFKQTDKISVLSPSIRNAFLYLMNPEVNLTMLSEEHRSKVAKNIFGIKYSSPELSLDLLKYFSRSGIEPANSKNYGALCTRILYLPFIKPIWDDSFLKKGVFQEEIENYDLSLASSLIEECLKNRAKKLDLGNCGLTDLSIIPELFECTHIEELILSNEWSEYSAGKWRKRISNNKGRRNNIQYLPDDIGHLKELRILICGGDWNEYNSNTWNRWGIPSIRPLAGLNKLQYLNLSNNRLTGMKGLNKILNLKVAHLNNNDIFQVETLNDLVSLEELYLSNNDIKNIEFLSQLPNITTVDLHNNQIRDLRPASKIIERIGIANSKWEVDTLNIAKNPLEQPPMQIVNLGKEAVLSLFKDIEEGGRYINKDIKIILVGNSEVGKSTLVKYLDKEIGIAENHLPTLWMEEKTIKSKYKVETIGEECILHIFDFGGHDYYHDTHHMFYSTNTLYVLLWDEATNKLNLRQVLQQTKDGFEHEIETQDYPVKYWLDSVKFHTKDVEADNFEFEIQREDTYNSTLLLIQNKVGNASKIKPLNNETLKQKYPFIYDIINISIKDPKRNLQHFDNLFLEVLNSMNIIGAILPKFYKTVKDSITSYKGKPVLTISEFLTYCNSKLKSPIIIDQCRVLVKYLEQIGFILYSDKGTEEKVYINKGWIIESMHKILVSLLDKKGEFTRLDVENVVGVSHNIDDILIMMQEFKMIFKHPYSDSFIAPLYLPSLPDGKIKLFLNEKIVQYRRFEYNGFIHKSVILSIFQKFGTLIPQERNTEIFYYWKNGLVIKKPDTEEIVMIKFLLGNEEGSACIDIYELAKIEKHLFAEDVISYIREVNNGFEIEEMVTLNGEDFISKAVLEKNASVGKYLFSERRLSDLNNTKQEEKYFKLRDYMAFIDNPIKKKKVVISYSKKDLTQIHTLIRYLQPLIDAELIEQPWYCTLLNPADEWDAKIRSKFVEADVIFFMVSEYFYSTKYIVEKEIKTAIDRYDNGEPVKIIPIILEFYDWGRKDPHNLQRFSALPYQAKPISDFHNPKMAWNTITASVRMMIEKDLDPAKIEMINRDLQEIYERQVKGKLDNNAR